MKKSTLQKLLLTALFTALTAAGAILHIGDASLQTLFAALAGILLGPVWGPASQALYVFMGLVGLPLFINGGGPDYIAQPSFGYLLGMILSAFVTGILIEKTSWNIWLISSLGLLAAYLIGIPYCYFYFMNKFPNDMDFVAAINMGIVYLPLDFAKLFAVAIVGKRLLPTLRKDLYE